MDAAAVEWSMVETTARRRAGDNVDGLIHHSDRGV